MSTKTKQLAVLFAEKVGTAFLFSFIAVLAVGGTAGLYRAQQWATAADAGGYAAAVAVLTGIVTVGAGFKLSGYADAALRVGLQYVQSFLGAAFASASGFLSHVDWKGAAAIAFLATLPTVVKVLNAIVKPTVGASSLVLLRGTAYDHYEHPAAA